MDATFFATVALVIFIGIVLYLKVPGMITKSLDERADKIRDELDEARNLREEAQQLLAEYQRKRKEAEKEAEDIVTAAKKEADLIAEDAKKKSDEFVVRRTKLAEQKIAHAELEALKEVKASAVDVAIAATENLLGDKLDKKTSGDLITAGIAEVKANLN
jgi:F-type H+-transporting ATPase subunit b